MLTLLGLAAATLVSEDLTCVAAGVLVAEGRLNPVAAVAACAIGIVGGDLGVWGAGLAGERVFRIAAWRRRAAPGPAHAARSAALRAWLLEHAGHAIVASRFLPGTRLPLYLTAGAIGVPAQVFVLWSALAASIWTPLVVLGSAGIGLRVAQTWPSASVVPGAGRYAAIAMAIALLCLLRACADPSRRRRVAARVARWRRWEFWPMWLFYAPVAAWVTWLAVRYRGLGALTACNPGIVDGGLVGESKSAILDSLPRDAVIPSLLVPGRARRLSERLTGRRVETNAASRVGLLRAHADAHQWQLPLVLKPDVGQRGAGVRRIASWEEAERYLAACPGDVLAQPYHPGPFEAGVFYYRLPGWERGRVLSITDKVFPEVVGDGRSTLEDLIWRHPRYRLQARTFLARYEDASARVPAPGERCALALAGNHAQGTLFLDGRHLITPALEARIDQIAQSAPGFYIGRFDIRYGDVDEFKDGRGLAIVELNGATAESTHIYDPSHSVWSAYRALFHQWSLVFAIGEANRRGGAASTSAARLVSLVCAHLTAPPLPLAD